MLDETLFRERYPNELFFNVECPDCESSHDYIVSQDSITLVPETNHYVCYVECLTCDHEFGVNLSP